MGSDRWEVTCERCGRRFEVGLWSREFTFCDICVAELDTIPTESFEDKLPKPEDWPDVPSTPRQETEFDRQRRYTKEDHKWTMDHPYWGRKPKDCDS